MLIELTDQERSLLLDLLEHEHKEELHELHHTATASFKSLLKDRIELLEGLTAKLAGAVPVR
jgi:hypothetical protein